MGFPRKEYMWDCDGAELNQWVRDGSGILAQA